MDNVPINEFLKITIDLLSKWVSDATAIVVSVEKILAATSIYKHQLKSINKAILRLKEDIKDLFDVYKDIEKEFLMQPLSIEYYHASLEIREKVKKLITDIQSVAENFQYFIEKMEQNIDITQYITVDNQNSISFLTKLTEEDLLKLLEHGYLAGF